MKLNKLISCDYDIEVTGIETDSRNIERNYLFFAIKGRNVDGNKYVDEAIKNGACAIITENKADYEIPTITVDNINQTLKNICKKFYGYKEKISLIGITGTDGKTTTATILNDLINLKKKSAYIGTNGFKINNKYNKTDNTTPVTDKLYKYLAISEKEKCKNVVMEVSSEAILYKRINGLKFKYIIYTNITEDHLNIHKTVNEYIKTKNSLVKYTTKNSIIIVNNDDVKCQKMTFPYKNSIITYGKKDNSDFLFTNIVETDNTIEFDLINKHKRMHIVSPYAGKYNIYNLIPAIIVCLKEKIKITDITKKLSTMQPIPGRNEQLNFGQPFKIILDYAHTENGIKTIVSSYKNKSNNIIVVTGAAGGREIEKRSKIGKYLLNNVNKVIFTSDDPRFEKPKKIISDMIGREKKKNYKVIIDRKKAIEYALKKAKEKDIVLILGKGRDEYMAIKDRMEEYSDYQVIKDFYNRN